MSSPGVEDGKFLSPHRSEGQATQMSLKQRLSAEQDEVQQDKQDDGYFDRASVHSQRSGRASPPTYLPMPDFTDPAAVALAALQYLPTPLLVLSSLKIIVQANEAMGILLGLENAELEGQDNNDRPAAVDLLRGQTLSQIGIDMLQDGQPLWVNWETFLESLANDMDNKAAKSPKSNLSKTKDSVDSSKSSAQEEHQSQTGANHSSITSREVVHDSVVDVVLSSQFIGNTAHTMSNKDTAAGVRIHAKMIISIWKLEDCRFFTLSFSGTSNSTLASARSQSRLVSRTPTAKSISPSSYHSTTPSSAGSISGCCSTCGAINASTHTSPSVAPLAIAPLPLPNVPAAPTVLQKTLKMKDAILNAIETPIFVMWKDGSLAFPNKAGMRLMEKHSNPMSEDSYDLLSRFTAYTEDFSRELEPEELPFAVLCRTETSFKSHKIGFKALGGSRVIYDVTGEAVFDDKTHEFLAGMTTFKDVTEYTEKLKNQSEENERQFELICEGLPQLLWVTPPDGLPDWFSKRWYDYTGLTPEACLGGGWTTPFHPDDLEETTRRWKASLESGDEYITEYRCKRYDGVWRWMLGRALPLREPKSGRILRWFGTCTDIHEQVEALQAAKRFREHLCDVINHAHLLMWTVNKHGVLTFFEGRRKDDSGHKPGEFVGKSIVDALSSFDAKVVDIKTYTQPIETILQGKAKELYSEHHIKGEDRWFRTRYAAILGKRVHNDTVDSTYVDGVVGISFDVSELKRREVALRLQEQENLRLLSAETAAKDASRLKSQFLANMSHEIRTPIAGIIGMSELLIDTDMSEDQKECTENIQRSANGLLTVINDILDLSKVESGRLDIEEVSFSLSVVIRDVCKMMSFAAERKGLAFMEDIKFGLKEDLIVLGDPGRVRQILTNLLTNSIKFTSTGHVKLSVLEQESARLETCTVQFMVEDTGIGIEEEVRKRLFKPFSQADSSTARRFGGTGLGLTICRNLVELMHGTINLQSQLGSGTKACFSIPFNRPQFMDKSTPLVSLDSIPDRLQDDPSMSSHRSDRATPPQTPLSTFPQSNISHGSGESSLSEAGRKSSHVLVVEDNAINQQIALKTIRKLGFSVNAVWNGKEALEYLLRDHNEEFPRPDVILMDVQMPILDGYRATHLIRHHNPYSSLPGMGTVPILAMTASAIQGDREKCERAGMNDYLSKPVKPKVLEQMLVKWVLKSKQHAEVNHTLQSHHTDHDSNCTDEAPYMNDTKAPPSNALAPSNQGDAAQFDKHHLRLPGTESEGDREMRRIAAAEKAEALRNDKLLIASNKETVHHERIPKIERPIPLPSNTALTEANVGRFGREQARSDLSHTQEGKASSAIDAMDESSHSGTLHSPPPERGQVAASQPSIGHASTTISNGGRIPLHRHSSGTSQSTITRASSN